MVSGGGSCGVALLALISVWKSADRLFNWSGVNPPVAAWPGWPGWPLFEPLAMSGGSSGPIGLSYIASSAELALVVASGDGCCWPKGSEDFGELDRVFPVDDRSSSSLLTCSVDLANALTAWRSDALSTAQLCGHRSSKAADEKLGLPNLLSRGGLRVSLIRQSMIFWVDSGMRLA